MKYDTGKRLSIILVGFILLCFGSAVPAAAQDVNVTATVDSTNISLGDWIHLTVEAKHPSSLPVTWQALRDSIGPFEIVRLDTLRTEEANGVVTEKRALIVSRYEPGSSAIPPIGVTYRTAGDTTVHTAQSNPIPIEVRGIAVDTSLAIKDLKQPLTVPLSWQEISIYAGIVLLICLLAYGAYWYWKKKQQQIAGIVEEKPVIPPDILALQQLRELEGKHIWQSGEVKLFYSEATEIVRRYFEGRYGIAALEMTTDEVLDQLKSTAVPRGMAYGMLTTINEFLTGADLVKFAKFVPTPADNEQVIPVAAAIVQKTKPSTIPIAGPSGAAPAPTATSAPGSAHAASPASTQISAPGSTHAATPVAQPSHIPDQTPDKNAGDSEHV